MIKAQTLFSVAMKTLYITAGLFLVYHLVRAGGYYLTPLSQRPFHPDYQIYKPAGSLGLRFGVAGTLMLLALLFYSLRKRTRLFGNLFRVKYWLDVHILFGITGPIFILLHTSFKFDGLVAVSFWSMAAVALSGVFGRYLYVQIPRNIQGDEIDVRELERDRQGVSRGLATRFELEPAEIENLLHLFGHPDATGKTPSILGMIGADIRRWWALRRLRKTNLHSFQLNGQEAAALLRRAAQKSLLETRIARLRKVRQLFHYWHVIHRPFALIMYLIMLIHIVVALLFGISWRKGT